MDQGVGGSEKREENQSVPGWSNSKSLTFSSFSASFGASEGELRGTQGTNESKINNLVRRAKARSFNGCKPRRDLPAFCGPFQASEMALFGIGC